MRRKQTKGNLSAFATHILLNILTHKLGLTLKIVH